MVGDAGENIGEPRLRIDIVEASDLGHHVEHRPALSVAISSAEQPSSPSERYTT
jgi:hypothetical protein